MGVKNTADDHKMILQPADLISYYDEFLRGYVAGAGFWGNVDGEENAVLMGIGCP